MTLPTPPKTRNTYSETHRCGSSRWPVLKLTGVTIQAPLWWESFLTHHLRPLSDLSHTFDFQSSKKRGQTAQKCLRRLRQTAEMCLTRLRQMIESVRAFA